MFLIFQYFVATPLAFELYLIVEVVFWTLVFFLYVPIQFFRIFGLFFKDYPDA